MSELAFESARSLGLKIQAREVSSRELLDYFLARIERHNPALNAVVTLDVERARESAQKADAALARGVSHGPLHGVPMTIKDAFEVAGVRSTAGAKVWRNHVPAHDAIAVARLRAAGAIIMGKTNTPAFCADLQSYNELFGTTNNPWDVARTPGGSSGGSAAALAAGLTPIELGSDIGGSIRTPSSWSGVCGHKPSYEVVPQRGHLPPPPGALTSPDLAVIGPLARSIDDLALMLSILAGPPPEQAHAYTLQLPAARATQLRGYRVAVWFDDESFPIDDSVRGCLDNLTDSLRRAGVHLEQYRPNLGLKRIYQMYRSLLDPITSAGLPAKALDGLRSIAASDASLPEPLTSYARNALISHRDWLLQHEMREQLRRECRQLFERCDVLLCPVNPVTAIPHDQSETIVQRTIRVNGETRPYMELFAWVALASACYLPATVVPIGQRAGLPVGVQVIGPYLEDSTTLDFAGRVSELLGGFVAPPGF